MRPAIFSCVFLTFCCVAFAQLAQYGKPPPGKPGFCWSDATGPMEKGEEKTVECTRATCNKDQTLTRAGCGVVSVDGVRLTEVDLSKPYPQCCPGQH